MGNLLPWYAAEPNKKYVKSESTDIRKTFRAARKKQVRELELKRRRELAKMKGAMK